MLTSIFTKIINREIPSKILYEDELVIAIYDINPIQPGHFLVIPKNQANDLLENSEEDYLYTLKIARNLAKQEMIKNNYSGFKLLANTGKSAGQEIFHTHIHIIPYK
ncbi:histidine triad protein HinT [Mycoplasmopsis felis]|uniref:histidine triad protein HinT n=1 Tax=Mycoplasmopsis felis TaxID=33923 RepID=UPI002AFF1972|nr:HIT domain-containing protein [Mycoplasmopsis felis]WQQ10486.1 HIT domain-containing protein [Mycoplasmopsis felis]